MDFATTRRILSDLGAVRLYAKELSENDNSKNQVYFGPGFEVLNIIPNKGISPNEDPEKDIFKAKLDFWWVNDDGSACLAPNAQLILYPQYPEVRFSGFLAGSKGAPSELMAGRLKGRILFLGVCPTGKILAMVAGAASCVAKEFLALGRTPDAGVFVDLTLKGADDSRLALLGELKRINQCGWIDSKRLHGDGTIGPCNARNCGGLTLEAELGIRPNSLAEPDYLGWEIKQHSVPDFTRISTGVITLMTPEPIGGIYHEEGPEAFIRKFGYADKLGRPDRINFGGVHKAGERHPLTGLTLQLTGFDRETNKISKDGGGIALFSDNGECGAFWPFAGLMTHWVKKHSRAAYIPAMMVKEPLRYCYGDKVRLAIKTDFLRFLKAMNSGKVYYDPGLKLENASTKPKVKRRNQFRIKSSEIGALYESLEVKSLY